jgi:hypothetical protein
MLLIGPELLLFPVPFYECLMHIYAARAHHLTALDLNGATLTIEKHPRAQSQRTSPHSAMFAIRTDFLVKRLDLAMGIRAFQLSLLVLRFPPGNKVRVLNHPGLS